MYKYLPTSKFSFFLILLASNRTRPEENDPLWKTVSITIFKGLTSTRVKSNSCEFLGII